MKFYDENEFAKVQREKYKINPEIKDEYLRNLLNDQQNDIIRRDWEYYIKNVKLITSRLNSPIFEPGNINVEHNHEMMRFSIMHRWGQRCIFELTGCDNEDDPVGSISCYEFDQDDIEKHEPIYTGNQPMFRVFTQTLFSFVHCKEDIEKLIAIALNIEESEVHFNFVEPVTDVYVHKVTGLPLYYFNTEGVKHVVTIERNPGENRDYVIKICTSDTDNMMLELSGVKTGKLFRTVLLKRLNDWYKEKYQKRARFNWGANVNME
jgi:hypothetical protein